MKRHVLCLAVSVAAAAVGSQANAAPVLIATFDENHYPVNPMNGFGAFTFGDFSPGGATTDGSTSLIFDVVDSNGTDGVFGGVGVDYGSLVATELVPIDFDPALAYWELRVKILEGNRASAVRTTVLDVDGLGSADEHSWEFDLTGVPDDGNFHSLLMPFPDLLFTQGAFGWLPGDTILNPGLRQIQIQSVFGSTERLHIEVDHATIWAAAVPEPTSLALLGLGYLGCCLMGARQRRSRLTPLESSSV